MYDNKAFLYNLEYKLVTLQILLILLNKQIINLELFHVLVILFQLNDSLLLIHQSLIVFTSKKCLSFLSYAI